MQRVAVVEKVAAMTDDTAYLEQVRAEHYGLEQILHQLAETMETALAQQWPDASRQRLVDLLRELRDQIECHFTQEEVVGYMEEALSRAPRFSAQAAALLKQHAEFAHELRDLLARSQAGRDNPGIWKQLHADLQALLKRLKAHEAGENRIIEAAFNEDLGLAD